MDEFPVGGGGGGGMSGAPPTEEDYSKLPLEDRLASKQWKARVSAYEELVRQFEKSPSESAPVFRPYTRNPDAVKAMVTDSNAVAQEKALEAVKAFLAYGGKAAGATREIVMPSVIEKCFGAMRAGTKKSALEIVSLYAEAEDVMGCEGLVGNLLQGTLAKQPKVVAGSVTALTQLVGDFGPRQVGLKPILKRVPDTFGHSDKTVRAEAVQLAQELHKWIGPALEPTLAALKDIQAKELREQFAKLDQAGGKYTVPTRYLTSQKPSAREEQGSAPAGAEGGENAGGVQQAEEVDAFDFLEPKDPLKAKDWPENLDEMINSTKWLERKEVLDQCIKVLEATPRIIHTPPIDSLIDVLSEKVKKDANINVVLSACQCIQRFALGLRGAFAKNKDKALPALLEKLKERKEATVKVLADTLDAVFLTVTISDVLEPTLNATKHKNPQVKTGAIQFLVRCLRETRSMPAKGDIKPIADALVSATADGSADVRDAGAQGLGTLMKLIGERAMNQYIDGLDDIKKGKIQEQFKTATAKVKQGGSAPAGARSAPAASDAKPSSSATALKARTKPAPAVAVRKPAVVAAAEKENAPPTGSMSAPPRATAAPVSRGPPARLTASKPAATKPTGPTAARQASSGAASSSRGGAIKAAGATDPVKYRFHAEEAEARAAELVPGHLQEGLSTSVWKDRLAAMVSFNEWLKLECEGLESEVIVRFLSRKPGWKESNFQVMGEMYNALRMLATDSPSFGRPSVAISIAPLCDKLGDIKLKGPAGETLRLYAEKTSVGFVLSQALPPLGNLKAPKAIADSLLWVNQTILEFGAANIDVRGLVSHLLSCLKSANAAVRTNATVTIGTLSRFLGTALTNLLGDLNPQLRATVEAEIEKASKDPAPTPTRVSDELRPKASASVDAEPTAEAAGPSQADEDALDALIPRVDLDNLMPSATVAKLGDANWKERKEGLEEVNAILDANTRLKPKMGELGTALKMRFADNNVQVRTMALEALSKIATGMGRGFDAFVRTFVAPVTQVLADSKAPMRAAGAKTLTAMAEQTGAAPMISGFASILEGKTANPMLRQDLFTWLGEWFEAHTPDKDTDLAGLALPAIVCLDDKLAAVRKAAQSVLPFIIMRAGYKFVMEQTNGLKAASRSTVIPLIDAARAQASSKAPPPPAPSTTVTTRLGGAPAPKVPNVVRKPQPPSNGNPAPASRSTVPSSAPSTATVEDSVSATPRSTVKPTSAVGRALKPAAPGRSISSEKREDTSAARLPRVGTRRPTASAMVGSSSSGATTEKAAPFMSGDPKFKAMREKREGGKNSLYWVGSDAVARPDLSEALRQQCEHHVTPSLIDTMFSTDHNAERDYLSALNLLADYLSHPETSVEDFGIEESEAVARAVANSDLIFKYVAIRLTDNNTSMALKCLDVLGHLIALLRGQEYHMSDYEANAILPCVLAKFGDPKVAFRDRIRAEILRKITYIYPPSKVLGHFLEEGLVSKNARVRTECLGELGQLFHKYGTQVCSLPRVLPQIAKQIADRDNAVRTAALMAISEVYKIVGDEIWQLVGRLPLKDTSLLEERLKRTAGPTSAPPSEPARQRAINAAPVPAPPAPSRPGPGAQPVTPSNIRASAPRSSTAPAPQPQQSRLAMPSRLARPALAANPSVSSASGSAGGGIPRSRLQAPSTVSRSIPRSVGSATPGSSMSNQDANTLRANGHSRTPSASTVTAMSEPEEPANDALGLPTVQRRSSPAPSHSEEDFAVEQAINEILSSDCDCSVMALKKVELNIQNVVPAMARHADQLAVAFQKQFHRAFNMEKGIPNNERLKKHLLITGTFIFDNTRLWEDLVDRSHRTLGSYVSKPALVSLLTDLLQQLIETKGGTDELSQTHGRYLNIIILRSFSSCSLNVLFGACLLMLAEATEDLEDLQERDKAILDKRVKFADLICKCIWKITRKLTVSLQEELIDATVLLQDLERFLQTIPPEAWKQRAANGVPLGDTPLRTVKVIVTHIGNCFGEESLELLEGIPDPENSHVYAHLLKSCDRVSSGHLAVEEGIDDEAGQFSPQSIPNSPQRASRSRNTSAMPASPRSIQSGGTAMSGSQSYFAQPHGSAVADDNEETDAALTAELNSIFTRISSKAESRAAIKELYLYRRRYPHREPHIRRSIEQTGPIFQKFIRRALANHAAEDGEGVTPFDDIATRRDSILSSPAGLGGSSVRSSTMDWQAASGMAWQQRNSLMSPSPSRNSNLAGLTSGGGSGSGGPSTPSAPAPPLFARTPGSIPNSPMPASSSPSMNRNSVNDDRLAQLRAKFSRPASNHNEAA